ncbi:hypothetical protein BV25DRAFT_1824943 [Artomyces pyxidatus]|uniref:Uncharacterized protein n=1 Tax=Artomyces pyxidatus TaxID=48021 RepID=A0ACB8T4J0_9AGAM|nr:hypothetical protein BV25DRAFT_1824943 [Artomyces pyxidatus]
MHSHSHSLVSLASSSDSSSLLSTPPLTPQKPHKAPQQIRLHPIGVDPSVIVGKVLTRVRRSPTHPAITLYFADNTTYQVRVDGYHPSPDKRGTPKELEMNSLGQPIFRPPGGQIDVHLTVAKCRLVQIKDTAHEWSADMVESRWTVEHLALAMNFEEEPGWRCVWATMAEYDGEYGPCTFRNFEDVYLDEMHPSSRKRKSRKDQARGNP